MPSLDHRNQWRKEGGKQVSGNFAQRLARARLSCIHVSTCASIRVDKGFHPPACPTDRTCVATVCLRGPPRLRFLGLRVRTTPHILAASLDLHRSRPAAETVPES